MLFEGSAERIDVGISYTCGNFLYRTFFKAEKVCCIHAHGGEKRIRRLAETVFKQLAQVYFAYSAMIGDVVYRKRGSLVV